jgi:hypothetical protein
MRWAVEFIGPLRHAGTAPLLTSRPALNEPIFVTKTSGWAPLKRFDTKLLRRATFGHAGTKPRKLHRLDCAEQQLLKELDR